MKDDAAAKGATIWMGFNKNVTKYVTKGREALAKVPGGDFTLVHHNARVCRADVPLMNRGGAAAGTWTFRGDASRRGRSREETSPPRPRRGSRRNETGAVKFKVQGRRARGVLRAQRGGHAEKHGDPRARAARHVLRRQRRHARRRRRGRGVLVLRDADGPVVGKRVHGLFAHRLHRHDDGRRQRLGLRGPLRPRAARRRHGRRRHDVLERLEARHRPVPRGRAEV